MSKYDRVNSFTHLVCGLVNFIELCTQFPVRYTVCTFGIVSHTRIADSLISLSCGLTVPCLVLCVLSEIHTGLWAQLLSCSCRLTISGKCQY